MKFQSTLLSCHWFSQDLYTLQLSKPAGFTFLPGQFISISYGNIEREYTLITCPDDPDLRVLIKQVPQGQLSNTLAKLPLGTTLFLSPARGYFCYHLSENRPCFIATGTGIAPFIAMAASGVRHFTLLHGVRHISALVYKEKLTSAAKLYVPCLSADCAGMETLPNLHRGHVSSYARNNLSAGTYDFYLCGLRAMIYDLIHQLDAQFPGSRVYSEAYD